MPTFVDKFFQAPVKWSAWAKPEVVQHFKDTMAKAETFVAYDVGEYFYAMDDREIWDLPNDFPGLIPPYKYFVIEFKRPSRIYSKQEGIHDPNMLPASWGTFFESYTRKEIEDLPGSIGAFSRYLAYEANARWPDDTKDWKYVLAATNFMEVDDKHLAHPDFIQDLYPGERNAFNKMIGHIVGPITTVFTLINPDGLPVKIRAFCRLGLGFGELGVTVEEGVAPAFYPAFYTLSLLNCRNVSTNVIHPPPKLNKARQKRGRRPLVSYYVLEIDLFKKAIRARNESGQRTDIKMALHLCRGHMKDYTTGKGLFGKYHGRYVWPQMIKGSKEEGTVIKDYKMEVKKDEQK